MKKISYNAPFTLTFCLLSLLVLIINVVTLKKFDINFTQSYFMIYRDHLDNPWFYFRLFSHILGHKDFSHFINNFLLILLIGPLLEEKYGSLYLTKMALINALITGLIFIIVFKNQSLFGASGVLFMMIMMTSFTNKEKNSFPLTLLFVAGLYLGQDLYSMIFKNDNISQATHLLGGLIGIYAIYYQQKMALTEKDNF